MKNKKIPLRKCVVTNEQYPKKELTRVVKNKDGEVFVDLTGKANGRGAYIMVTKNNIEKAKKSNALGRHLETKIPDEIYAKLEELIND